jgi:hypothetical protein
MMNAKYKINVCAYDHHFKQGGITTAYNNNPVIIANKNKIRQGRRDMEVLCVLWN